MWPYLSFGLGGRLCDGPTQKSFPVLRVDGRFAITAGQRGDFLFFFYGTGHICCGIMTRVSQMEHEECVCLCVRGCLCAFVKGELMSLLWAIIRTLAPHSAIIKGNISELPNGGPQHNTWWSGRTLSAELFLERKRWLKSWRWKVSFKRWRDVSAWGLIPDPDSASGSGSADYWQVLVAV